MIVEMKEDGDESQFKKIGEEAVGNGSFNDEVGNERQFK